jgi:transcriptional regulator with XRE-family HTH domain
MSNPEIGKRIEFRRKQLGLTLDDIAIEIGVARSTIQRYEKGSIEKIKLPVIEAIARVLDVNPAWLCGKADDMTVPGQTQKAPTPGPESLFSGTEVTLVEKFRTLNTEGQEKVMDYTDDLIQTGIYKNNHQSDLVSREA